MACEESEDRILERIDGTLAPEEESALDRHLAVCPRCRSYLEMHRSLDIALSDILRPPMTPPALRDDLAPCLGAPRSRRRISRLPELLDLLGYASLAVIAGFLLRDLPPLPPELSPAAGDAVVWAGASMSLLAALWAFWYSRPRQARR
jgi:anti-sigma factor RsiW